MQCWKRIMIIPIVLHVYIISSILIHDRIVYWDIIKEGWSDHPVSHTFCFFLSNPSLKSLSSLPWLHMFLLFCCSLFGTFCCLCHSCPFPYFCSFSTSPSLFCGGGSCLFLASTMTRYAAAFINKKKLFGHFSITCHSPQNNHHICNNNQYLPAYPSMLTESDMSMQTLPNDLNTLFKVHSNNGDTDRTVIFST